MHKLTHDNHHHRLVITSLLRHRRAHHHRIASLRLRTSPIHTTSRPVAASPQPSRNFHSRSRSQLMIPPSPAHGRSEYVQPANSALQLTGFLQLLVTVVHKVTDITGRRNALRVPLLHTAVQGSTPRRVLAPHGTWFTNLTILVY